MTAHRIAHRVARNSLQILHFVLAYLLASAGIGLGSYFLKQILPITGLMHVNSIVAFGAIAAIMVQSYRDYLRFNLVARATNDLWGWNGVIYTIDIVLGLAANCPGILPS